MTDKVTLITAAVAKQCGITYAQIMTPTHQRNIARPRQIAMALARELTKRSLPGIAQRFRAERDGVGVHHTTVLYSINRVAELRKDSDFNRLYEDCRDLALLYLDRPALSGLSSIVNEIEELERRLQARRSEYAARQRECVLERARSGRATASGRSAA